jgi:hypothetical protein
MVRWTGRYDDRVLVEILDDDYEKLRSVLDEIVCVNEKQNLIVYGI